MHPRFEVLALVNLAECPLTPPLKLGLEGGKNAAVADLHANSRRGNVVSMDTAVASLWTSQSQSREQRHKQNESLFKGGTSVCPRTEQQITWQFAKKS